MTGAARLDLAPPAGGAGAAVRDLQAEADAGAAGIELGALPGVYGQLLGLRLEVAGGVRAITGVDVDAVVASVDEGHAAARRVGRGRRQGERRGGGQTEGKGTHERAVLHFWILLWMRPHEDGSGAICSYREQIQGQPPRHQEARYFGFPTPL